MDDSKKEVESPIGTPPRKSHNISAYRSRESLVSDDLYQTCLLQLPFYLGVIGLFQDVLRILSVRYLSAY